jgi:hypothetical protein
MKTHLMILLVMIAALVAAAPSASAQGYGGCNGGWGWGYDLGYLYNSLDYNVPYFAAHPPVYYSYPVPRTYGYSPFAYPPGTMTPDVIMGDEKPVTIVNPYVPSSQQKAAAAADQSASTSRANSQPEPLVIINPYVAGAGAVAQASQ